MNVQDMVDRDLRRFMIDDMPDNVEELRTELKEHQTIDDVVDVQDVGVVEKPPLFTDAVNKELAKHRPNYAQKRRGVAMFGLAFAGIAMFSLLILPEPLNWVMASGSLIPFVVPLLKYKMAKRRVHRP